ncbi:MAG TPA: DUF6519 domain-containing protein [Kofleriaceae bacterium]
MNGDFTRLTHDPEKHYSAVLLQQGRVQLDADFNEQGTIQRELLRELASDLIGPHGGPERNLGFGTEPQAAGTWDFPIAPGRYWVGGLLCRNEKPARYTDQPGFLLRQQDPKLKPGSYLVYLDVFERAVNGIEDADILERALQGLDTSVRACLTWIVRATPFAVEGGQDPAVAAAAKLAELAVRDYVLEVQLQPVEDDPDPCHTSPESRYRGFENHLYRVEVHYGSAQEGGPTLKWSRENGSVVFAIESLEGATATLRELGRDPRSDLTVGDWVEILDDDVRRLGFAQPLARVTAIDRNARQITFETAPQGGFGQDPAKHPFLRRWDQRQRRSDPDPLTGGTIKLPAAPGWITLEDGIQVRLTSTGQQPSEIRSGDHWLIPARVTGELEFPGAPRPPHGVDRWYAPLALVTFGADGSATLDKDLRRRFTALAQP